MAAPGSRANGSEAALRRLQRQRATPVRTCAWKRCCGRCGACWAPEERRTGRDDAEFRANTRLFWRRAAGVTCRIFFRHSSTGKCGKHHGVIACEGSMFKSKFANALTTMMIGSLGIAAAENKLSHRLRRRGRLHGPVAGASCARATASQSLILTRNEASQAVLSALGVPSELGTDTAWTFEPHAPEDRPQGARGSRLGRPRAGAGCLPDPSVLVAGEGRHVGKLAASTHARSLQDRATIAPCTSTNPAQKWTQHSSITFRAWRARWRRFGRTASHLS